MFRAEHYYQLLAPTRQRDPPTRIVIRNYARSYAAVLPLAWWGEMTVRERSWTSPRARRPPHGRLITPISRRSPPQFDKRGRRAFRAQARRRPPGSTPPTAPASQSRSRPAVDRQRAATRRGSVPPADLRPACAAAHRSVIGHIKLSQLTAPIVAQFSTLRQDRSPVMVRKVRSPGRDPRPRARQRAGCAERGQGAGQGQACDAHREPQAEGGHRHPGPGRDQAAGAAAAGALARAVPDRDLHRAAVVRAAWPDLGQRRLGAAERVTSASTASVQLADEVRGGRHLCNCRWDRR